MLLSNARVRSYLQENYVLAWESVRAAPKVTIDFGNGHKMVRTIKGSTVFALCNSKGEVLDAFPGVYTPADFLALLEQSKGLEKMTPEGVRQWHQARVPALAQSSIPAVVGKGLVESPLVGALGLGDHPTAPGASAFSRYASRVVDVSARPPASRPSGDVVALDSRIYREKVRPAVHIYMAGRGSLPTPRQTLKPFFQDLLKVPLDDPYLGLKENLPGTP